MADCRIRPSLKAIRKVKNALDHERLRQKILEDITGLSSQTIVRFLWGEPIDQASLNLIYDALDLPWEEGDVVVDSQAREPIQNINLEVLIQELRQHCGDRVLSRYSQTQLLNLQKAPVDRFWVDLYHLEALPREAYFSSRDLLEKTQKLTNRDRFGLGERRHRGSGLDIANQYQRLIILGKRGSGKSTFLRHLAIACCQEKYKSDYIPVLIELKNCPPVEAGQTSFFTEYLHREFALSHISLTEQVLCSGKVLILFDGLDEIPDQFRRNVQYIIRNFCQRYYKNQIILTSQTQITECNYTTFEYFEIADFNPKQIQEYAKTWFTALVKNPVKSEALTKQFLTKLNLPENHAIKKIAINPIDLSLACWVYIRNNDLPQNPLELYDRGFRLFLETWVEENSEGQSSIYKNMSVENKIDLFCHLATVTLERGLFFLDKRQLQTLIARYITQKLPPKAKYDRTLAHSEAILKAIESQHGIIIKRSYELYSFASQAWHEYFVSYAILDKFHLLTSDLPFSQFISKNWRTFLGFSLQRMQNPDEFVLQLKQKIDGILASDRKLQIFLEWVTQKAILVQVSYKPSAARAFYFSQALGRIFEPKLSRPLDFSHAVDRALKSDLHDRTLAYQLDEKLGTDFKNNAIRNLDYDLAVDLILDCLLVTYAYDLNLFLTYSHDRDFDLDPELQQSLKRFKNQIPNTERDDQKYQKWLRMNGKIWTQNLRMAIIQHRNIGYEWQFSLDEKELLKQYYYANKILVECLQENNKVSPQVKQEVEDTLLLPIVEIEKHQQEFYHQQSRSREQ
ncbi:MAG: NACHT domain-containing protein [Spirulinaceae cyanobacterium]